MKVKAISLVLDFNLYPRHHVDQQCVADYVAALKAGAVFPPIIADKASKRVVDGFKRTTAALRFGGDDAEIEVTFKSYPSEAELLLDAIRLNADHGERLGHYDIGRCIILGHSLKITDEKLAAALSLTLEKLRNYAYRIMEGPGGESVVGKRISIHLQGQEKPLTAKQTEGIKRAGGNNQLATINQVISLIESRLLDRSDERVLDRLARLAELLEPFVRKAAA